MCVGRRVRDVNVREQELGSLRVRGCIVGVVSSQLSVLLSSSVQKQYQGRGVRLRNP